MPDLAERVREYVETAQPPITIDEVKGAVERRRRENRPVRPRRLVFVSVTAALVVVALVVSILVLDSQANKLDKDAGPTAPRWSLVVDTQQPSWQVQGSANPGSYALVCPTHSNCYATSPSSTSTADPSGVVQVSKDGGQSWHASLVTGAGSDLSGLTCPSPTTCMVTGEDFASGSLGVAMFSTSDGGVTWTHQVIPGGSLDSSLLSCSSATKCVATMSSPGPEGQGLQDKAIVTSDGGVHWTIVPFPGTFRPYALQCLTGGHCVAVGQSPTNYRITSPASMHGSGSAFVSNDGGLTWQMGQVPTADTLMSLSCADNLHCLAVESTYQVTDSTASAVSLDDSFVSTSDGGLTWVVTTGNRPTQWSLGTISCPTASECWASGESHAPSAPTDSAASWQGFVVSTVDGGQTWNPVQLPQYEGVPVSSVSSLSCPDSATCFALALDPTAHAGLAQSQLVLVSRTLSP
jgi:hypothetical protein